MKSFSRSLFFISFIALFFIGCSSIVAGGRHDNNKLVILGISLNKILNKSDFNPCLVFPAGGTLVFRDDYSIKTWSCATNKEHVLYNIDKDLPCRISVDTSGSGIVILDKNKSLSFNAKEEIKEIYLKYNLISNQTVTAINDNSIVFYINKHFILYDYIDEKEIFNKKYDDINGVSSSFVVYKNLLINFGDNYIFAVDVKDGSLLWKKEIISSRENVENCFDYIEGIQIVDGKMIFVSQCFVYCIDCDTGKQLWKTKKKKSFRPDKVMLSNNLYILSNYYGSIAVNINNGVISWEYRHKRFLTNADIYKDYLIAAEEDGKYTIISLQNGNIVFEGVSENLKEKFLPNKHSFYNINGNLYLLTKDGIYLFDLIQ